MSNRYVGTKIETSFRVIYNHYSLRHERHWLVVRTNLYSTKGWKSASRSKKVEVVSWEKAYPRVHNEVRFSRSC